MYKFSDHDGFSLIEMLVVLAIMAILTMAAVPNYRHFVAKAHYFEVSQVGHSLRMMVEHCYQSQGSLDKCHAGHGGIPRDVSFHTDGLVKQAKVLKRGVIHVVPKAKHGLKASDDFKLVPRVSDGYLVWELSGGAVANGYVDQ